MLRLRPSSPEPAFASRDRRAATFLTLATLACTSACGGGGGGGSGPPLGGGGAPPGTGPDPLLPNQWHLENTGQNGGTAGEDTRVVSAWTQNVSGQGVRISIVDNGFELEHPDLRYNVPPGGSYSYVDGSANPAPGDHGTSCGGVAAGVGTNGIGISGAAYEAEVVGFNILANNTVANQLNAMTRDAQVVDISNNSWGPADELGILSDSPQAWRDGIVSGITSGRGGLGIVYCWAAGNGNGQGASPVDNSNYDGYASHYGVISVAAVDNEGDRSFYSEQGANVWIAAPSNGNGVGITTVDLTGANGYNDGNGTDYSDADYTATFGGTSSATPLVAGIIGLILEAQPNLTWSDVRWILAQTARRNDAGDADWATNGAGFDINHKYGFGVVDANAAVTLAQTWTSKSALQTEDSNWIDTTTGVSGGAIPDNDPTGITLDFNLTGSAFTELEYVTFHADVPDHPYWADLEMVLTSPSGTQAVLCATHPAEVNASGEVVPRLAAWRFGVARFLGEAPNGTWSLTVRDGGAMDTGTLERVRFQFHGR